METLINNEKSNYRNFEDRKFNKLNLFQKVADKVFYEHATKENPKLIRTNHISSKFNTAEQNKNNFYLNSSDYMNKRGSPLKITTKNVIEDIRRKKLINSTLSRELNTNHKPNLEEKYDFSLLESLDPNSKAYTVNKNILLRKEKNFDDFNHELQNIYSNYVVSSKLNDNNNDLNSDRLIEQRQKTIKNIRNNKILDHRELLEIENKMKFNSIAYKGKAMNKNNSLVMSTINKGLPSFQSEFSNIKVELEDKTYNDIYEALSVVKSNKQIYSELFDKLHTRNRLKMKEFKNNVAFYDKEFYNNKIKVLPILNKFEEVNTSNNNINNDTNLLNSSLINNKNELQGMNSNKNQDSNNINNNANAINNSSMFNNIGGSYNAKKRDLLVNFKFDFNILKDNPELAGMYYYTNTAMPEGRDQFSLSFSDDNPTNAFIFGGDGSCKSNSIWKYNIKNVEFSEIEGTHKDPLPRYGHSATFYNNRIYVFGGKIKQDLYFFHGDLEIFDMEFHRWHSPSVYTKSLMKMRRNHIAVLVGQLIFIHGGLSEDNEYLNDSYLLSFSPLKWNVCSIKTNINIYKTAEDNIISSSSINCSPPNLVGHAACLVLQNDIRKNPKFNIYKYPESNSNNLSSLKTNYKIKERGVYIFGGKVNDEVYNNEVYVLKIGKKPLEWKRLIINGKPPLGRTNFTMNYIEELNFLIIHGGRNDYYSYYEKQKLKSNTDLKQIINPDDNNNNDYVSSISKRSRYTRNANMNFTKEVVDKKTDMLNDIGIFKEHDNIQLPRKISQNKYSIQTNSFLSENSINGKSTGKHIVNLNSNNNNNNNNNKNLFNGDVNTSNENRDKINNQIEEKAKFNNSNSNNNTEVLGKQTKQTDNFIIVDNQDQEGDKKGRNNSEIKKPPQHKFNSSITQNKNLYSTDNILDYALDDFWLLDLTKLEWLKINITFEDAKSTVYTRCGHCSFTFEKKLYIFGGMNSTKYLGSHVFVIDLNGKKQKVNNMYKKNQSNPFSNTKKMMMNGLTFIK